MPKLVILSGNWKSGQFKRNKSYLSDSEFVLLDGKEIIPFSSLTSITQLDEKEDLQVSAPLSVWGAMLGGILGGKWGILTGSMLGTQSKPGDKVTFLAVFEDGRRLIGMTHRDAFNAARRVVDHQQRSHRIES